MTRAFAFCCFAALTSLSPIHAQPLDPNYGAIIDRSIDDYILSLIHI